MTASKSDVKASGDNRAKIKEIVCEILEINPNDITDASIFTDDHGADSMSAIALLSALEITFDIEIDQSDMARMIDLQGVIGVVDDAVAAT